MFIFCSARLVKMSAIIEGSLGNWFIVIMESSLLVWMLAEDSFDWSASFISYRPGALSTRNLAAKIAPVANICLERAVWLISSISSLPAYITVCSPAIVPARIECIPISLDFLFSLDEYRPYTYSLGFSRPLLIDSARANAVPLGESTF